MTTRDKLLDALKECDNPKGLTATSLSEALGLDRSSVSRYLNQLTRDGVVKKIPGKPVYFKLAENRREEPKESVVTGRAFEKLVGTTMSLSTAVQQAKAAILYPPRGLHTLVLGETGVGKSMFAELMYEFALQSKMLEPSAPFIRFNCADYADNPQLLMSQIFGVKKGAFTGAGEDRVGLLKRADTGILFLDEVHRLSPQGQEMLFTFMDKGIFRRMGDTDAVITSDVQLIAATTEDPGSVLLKTFMRRIPMMITLPALRDRELVERYYLIEAFLKEEAARLQKSIYINRNSLASLLLYECPNNIGQMKSDLQLACAKAFLRFKTKDEIYILINQGDLPTHVKRGLMQLKDRREDIDKLLNPTDDLYKFGLEQGETTGLSMPDDNSIFYDIIERKMDKLKEQGIEDEAINEILNIDIEEHFHSYIGTLSNRVHLDELSKVVDEPVLKLTTMLLNVASEALNKKFDERIFFGLCLHLQGSIDRIRKGVKIYHPKLNYIRVTYEAEFIVAMRLAKMIDQEMQIETPLDEIGYLTMFLASDRTDETFLEEEKVGILVIMHGNSTASSMVNVANSLLGTEHAKALDMPLSMSAESMYAIAKDEVKKMDRGMGVMLLVDMGSLTNFSDMIVEETGVTVRSIDMVSTPIVLEACRKAILGRDLIEIYKSLKTDIRDYGQEKPPSMTRKKVIITACFTGEGASKTLKDIAVKRLGNRTDIEVKTLNVLNKKDFIDAIKMHAQVYRIMCIISTVQIDPQGFEFIPAIDFMTGKADGLFDKIIESENVYDRVAMTVEQHIEGFDAGVLISDILHVIDQVEKGLELMIHTDVKLGIILHMAFMMNRLKKGEEEVPFENLKAYLKDNQHNMIVIQEAVTRLEKTYDLYIGANEQAYLCRMVIENKDNQ
ncbi:MULTISPECIES: sigma 54-interacting transcriptional regulator [unclassified Fusibacter]|uniref:sigma 54-interacting transcriptional regulator n=1 Tax=unclassified Fusibacter TaxID=2624464 RepID=UPI0010134F1B|nr:MULTISPECIES: sigma-54-dependent transcriptional regulator [unclassified Fusibacter]MCK8059375.1 sigma 54-interacting transcriptional regulator [Fusibacter sp. A2]NPE21161.1 sigma 54-interacting transcriptional regulator [Fusibacter sp. A1]RXV62429.1 sigma-54-dependent transcriptional regulator [Fusibacter sp. A1]